MAKGDAAILSERNKALGTSYKTINDYLTNNGKFKVGDANYTRRQTFVQNARGTAKREAFVAGTKWQDYITSKYGWLVSVYETVPEVAQIIRDGYIKGTPIGELQTKIVNSAWANSLQAGEYEYIKATSLNDRAYLDSVAVKERDVRNVAGKSGLALTDQQVTLLAAGAMKGNWDQQQIADEVGRAAVRAAQTGASPVSTTPAGTTPTALQQTADAGGIRELARKYGVSLPDSVVESYVQGVLQGTVTVESITNQLRNQAKSLYPAIAQQLDAGSVEDATQSYRSIAAQVLEIDPSSVDFSNPNKFGKLLTYKDPDNGQARLMNATEWNQYLRTLPDWSKTKDAKQTYSSIIDTVNSIYGKVG